MKIKNLILILFIAFFWVLNYSSADVLPDPCNYHAYEAIEKLPEWYVLLERYIDWDNTIDKVFEAKETLTRNGWQYGEWDYELYLIPELEKSSETKWKVWDNWITVPTTKFTTVFKRDVNQRPYGFWRWHDCYPRDKEYLYEISLEWDGVSIIPNWERERVIKRLSYYEKRYGGERYKLYKTIEFILAYLLTILSETLLLWLICKTFIKENITTKKIILTWVLCSWITLPMLWYVFPLFMWDEEFYVIWWEILVLIIEAIIMKYMLKLSRLKALLISFVCNLASFILWITIWSGDPRKNIESFIKAIIVLIFWCLVLWCSNKKIKALKEWNQKLKLSLLIIALIALILVWWSLINFIIGLYL